MAKLVVFSVLDAKVGVFEQPFFMRTIAEGLRSWGDVVNREDTKFCVHPNDFALMHIADYDDQTGKFENLSVPNNLGLAIQYKSKPESQMPLFDANKVGSAI